jgi:hypothetical protein
MGVIIKSPFGEKRNESAITTNQAITVTDLSQITSFEQKDKKQTNNRILFSVDLIASSLPITI